MYLLLSNKPPPLKSAAAPREARQGRRPRRSLGSLWMEFAKCGQKNGVGPSSDKSCSILVRDSPKFWKFHDILWNIVVFCCTIHPVIRKCTKITRLLARDSAICTQISNVLWNLPNVVKKKGSVDDVHQNLFDFGS